MNKHIVEIESIDKITHNVIRIVTKKPKGYKFAPGQATEIAINKKGWEDLKRPFTFTSLPTNDYLEFMIKTYRSHKGVTNELSGLKENDKLILYEPFGSISYKGEGLFIAGGTGITPFISIFRHLNSIKEIGDNKLIFANKTKNDIILLSEFERLLGKNLINILSDEKIYGYAHGLINEDFIKSYANDSTQNIYICGPPLMMNAIKSQLSKLGFPKNIITEENK